MAPRRLRKPDATARKRAAELSRSKGIGCRAIADRLEAEGWRVSKSLVGQWLKSEVSTPVSTDASTASTEASTDEPARGGDRDPESGRDDDARARRTTADSHPAGHRPEEPAGRPGGQILDASTANAFETRVDHIADLVATGHWDRRRSVRALSSRWGVSMGAVQNYARAAYVLARTDVGAREEARSFSLGRWERLYAAAVAENDVKAAAAAQKGWDMACGVVEPGGTKVFNLYQHPSVRKMAEALARVADKYEQIVPGMRTELIGAMRAALSGVEEQPVVIEVAQEPAALPQATAGATA